MEGCAFEVRALFWEACHLPRLQSLWMSKQGIACPIKGAGDGSVPFVLRRILVFGARRGA